MQGFFAWVGRALRGIFARPSTADLLTNDLFGDRRNKIRDGLSDPAAVMVVEWRIRAKQLRFFAHVFLIWIILALFLGLFLVWATDFLIRQGVKTAGEVEIELITKRNAEALKQIKTAATELRARQDNIIKEMTALLRGGGTVWHEVKTDTAAALLNMQFVSRQTGWVIGSEGTILHTADGETWSKAVKGQKADFVKVHFVDATTGWVIGSEGTILHTSNGEKWTKVNLPTKADLFEIHFTDAKTGWVIGNQGTILHTSDGQTWTKAKSLTIADLLALHFADANTGWVIGKEGTILHTLDGEIWTKAETGTTALLRRMHFSDANTGWVIGDGGTILHTTDGEKWDKADIDATADLLEMHFTDTKTGWVVGREGTILNTTDGQNWTELDSGTTEDLWRMYFADDKTGWVIGRGGTILHTTDGQTWTKAETLTTAPLLEVRFVDATTGWVVGFGGTILHTTDGKKWDKADSGTTNILSMLHFADQKTGWVIGFGGILLATRDYDITLAGLAIDAQIKEAKDTPLKDLFEKKGFLAELKAINESLQENKEKQKSITTDIEAFRRVGTTGTLPKHPAKENSPDATIGTGAGTDGAFGAFSLQTSIIRITTILLIAFLVQILVGLYRYNTRLAGYYDARADAVLMTKFAGMEFEKLVQLLSPDTVAFGRQPRSPAGNAVAVAREALRSVR